MADLRDSYPFATASGDAIPNDVIRPKECYVVALSTSASTEFSLNASYKVVVLHSDVDCFIRFGGTAAIPSGSTPVNDSVFLPKNTLMTVAPAAMSISAITSAGTGSLRVTIVASWAGLGLEIQTRSR